MQNKLSHTNLLIIFSLIWTILYYLYSPNILLYSFNNDFIEKWLYYYIPIQFILWTFMHWSILHFAMNSIFLYYFWNPIESLIWWKKYLSFIIFSIIFIWTLLIITTNWYTIWISWFAMALLAYYSLELKSRNNPEYKWWITAIIINIWIWLHPQISLEWHLYWLIAWIIFFLINKKWLDFLNLFKKNEGIAEQ